MEPNLPVGDKKEGYKWAELDANAITEKAGAVMATMFQCDWRTLGHGLKKLKGGRSVH